jgi:parallel beta-helix repeat protein
VKNNAAWDNNANGFTENSNTGSLTLSRNTAYDNGGAGFYFSISTSTLTGNCRSPMAARPRSALR